MLSHKHRHHRDSTRTIESTSGETDVTMGTHSCEVSKRLRFKVSTLHLLRQGASAVRAEHRKQSFEIASTLR